MAPKVSALQKFASLVNVSPESLTQKLLRVPIKDPDKPHRDNMIAKAGIVQQADVLYLQKDGRYKFALVVVDVATGKTAARPITAVASTQVVKAFKSIYAKGDLELPQVMIQTDGGPEFKGLTQDYFEKHKILIRYGKPHRSRQQAFAENRNWIIGKMISLHQHSKEFADKAQNPDKKIRLTRKWVHLLPLIVKTINETLTHAPYKPSKTDANVPVCKKTRRINTCALLKVGQRVRVILDVPRDTNDKILFGKFRAGDRRWSMEIHTIENVIIKPTQPPLYQVSGIKQVAYTKAQLMVVKPSEEKARVVVPKKPRKPRKPRKKTPKKKTPVVVGKRVRKQVDPGAFVK